jgi:hypothetical protein
MANNRWKGSGPSFLRSSDRTDSIICKVCGNLDLQASTLPRDPKRLDLFDLIESADENDCIWCSLIYRSMLALGAELPQPGLPGYARVIARKGKPFYVEWHGGTKRIAAEIYDNLREYFMF